MVDADQLLELAASECASSRRGRPALVGLRRAVSSAYYAVFHEVCGAAATGLVSGNNKPARTLIYRAFDHGKLKDRCARASRKPIEKRLEDCLGIKEFPDAIRDFAAVLVQLQILRHSCDYDPDFGISRTEAQSAIADAKRSIQDFRSVNLKTRLLFLTYLLFDVRA